MKGTMPILKSSTGDMKIEQDVLLGNYLESTFLTVALTLVFDDTVNNSVYTKQSREQEGLARRLQRS